MVGANFVTEPDESCIKETVLLYYFATHFQNVDVREIGPIGVVPGYQGHNVGRKLMQAAIHKATESNSTPTSLRLLVNSHNPVSFSLYLSLGFVAQQSVTCLINKPISISLDIPAHLRYFTK
jgi:GNAT superfamily N-acetyltransferase